MDPTTGAPVDEIVRGEWPAPAAVLAKGRRFLEEMAAGARVTIVPDGDADGLCAGVLLERVLRARGVEPSFVLAAKGENVHAASFRARLAATAPARVVVLDTGSRGAEILPGVPLLLVDHHRPQGFPPGAVVVSAFGHAPVAPTSLLTLELVRPIAGAGNVLEENEWLGVVGGIADMGEPEARARIEKRYGKKNVSETIALVNAPRRSSSHDVAAALEALRAAAEPADIAKGRVPVVERLRTARAEVNAEMTRWGRAAPKFAGRIAIIPIASGARIHPLMAMRWSRRIPGYAILAANWGYLPGRVNFSMRTTADTDLIDLLRSFDEDGALAAAEFAHGHPQATGGSLSTEAFTALLARMGFASPPTPRSPSR